MPSPGPSKNIGGCAAPPGEAEPRRKTEVLINRLGELRDGLLLLAGFVYLLGYTSWANYALTTRIGLVPVLDAQYFAAGIVPALILLLFILSVRMLRAFQRWLKRPHFGQTQECAENPHLFCPGAFGSVWPDEADLSQKFP